MKSTCKPKMEQQSHWGAVFTREPAFFGEAPSGFAQTALDLLRREGMGSVLELGCGQGRDSFHFARNGLRVTALDYAEMAVSAVRDKAAAAGLSSLIVAQAHDVRQPLPFAAASFDACYSHMLLCMEVSAAEISFILGEIRRILRPGGIAMYSVRSNFDKHYRTGTPLGEDLYEIGGFVVHFFTEEKIQKLTSGYEILKIERMAEGSLPRDLFCITLRKAAAPAGAEKERMDIKKPMERFQAAIEAALAPGALGHKTKQLVALGAALATGCDP